MDIEHLYLTFETAIPEANTTLPRQTPPLNAPPPPPPDLTRFANPLTWPRHRKNVMLVLSCSATFITAYSAGSYAPPSQVMADALSTSYQGIVAGITTFCMGFALAPMVLAPLSELHGRYPVFVASGVVFVVMQVACAVSNSLAAMLVSRFLMGVGGSVFSTVVGGVIADVWHAEDRNTPMALFSGSVLVGTGAGPLVGSVFTGDELVRRGMWRWVFWHQAIATGALMIFLIFFFSESRGSVLLSRRARALNRWYEELEGVGYFGVWIAEEGGCDGMVTAERRKRDDGFDSGTARGADEEKQVSSSRRNSATSVSGARLQRIRWRVKADEERSSVTTMIKTSVYRPFMLLFAEPVVFFFSLWVAFAWAILYLTFGCIPLVFTTVYGWSSEAAGRIFVAMIVGSVVATAAGIAQERLLHHRNWAANTPLEVQQSSSRLWSFLRRRLPTDVPESRLYFTCLSATLLPIGLFIFGLSARADSHWLGPAVAIGLATAGIFAVYLATFNYLADIYHVYASSALAGQSFCRNVLGGVFPLVTRPLFLNLGPGNAGVLLGCIGTALTLVPWVLVFYGERIRARSHFAVALTKS